MVATYAPAQKERTSIKQRWAAYSQKVTASLEIKKQKHHLLVLDGLRAVACLAVVLHHVLFHVILPANLWQPRGIVQILLAAELDFGGSAVILFFLLSSFLLFLPFAKALLFDDQWPSASRFYIRRFFRIVPGYYTAIILMVLFFHPEFLQAANRGKLLEFFTFAMQAGVPDQLNGPFWTMAVEFQFYLLLPLIALALSFIVRRGTLRWRVTKLAVCLMALLGWGLVTRWWGLAYAPATTHFTSFPQNVLAALQPFYYGDSGKYYESFAVGMFLALLYVYTQNAGNGEWLRNKLQRRSPMLFFAGLIMLGMLAVWSFVATSTGPLLSQFFDYWESLGYSICYGFCMCALLFHPGWLKRPFEWSVLRWIGLFSFSLYMWHYLLLLLFRSMLSHFQGVASGVQIIAVFAWVIFVIIPISLTLYRWIEMPGMRLGEALIQRISRPKRSHLSDVTKNSPLDDSSTAMVEMAEPHIPEQQTVWGAER